MARDDEKTPLLPKFSPTTESDNRRQIDLDTCSSCLKKALLFLAGVFVGLAGLLALLDWQRPGQNTCISRHSQTANSSDAVADNCAQRWCSFDGAAGTICQQHEGSNGQLYSVLPSVFLLGAQKSATSSLASQMVSRKYHIQGRLFDTMYLHSSTSCPSL